MANVFDVAKYILHQKGEMTAMKLQKLVYYSQAWSLVWDGKPLFREKIRAWANGPVVPSLYAEHRGAFIVNEKFFTNGDPQKLTKTEKSTINAVVKVYGKKTPQFLSELTHNEDPWKNARKGLDIGERGNQEITLSAMAEYYESLI
ncbi:MAG TPA: type II toxin-antitoxin system antitoxin SocA domain-containing protein [Anaerolineales bacterium]|nr:type II toxin-antitoxin system antitoxin SocA domain-containing protein [Anaerolineales bacterium]